MLNARVEDRCGPRGFFFAFFLPFISFCQKCDRQQPCTLCKNRGVEHLCRWELEPFARPSPARPPATLQTERQGTPGEQTSNVASSPEATISEPIRASPSLVTVPAVAGTSGSHLDTVSSGGHLDHDVKEAAITLAQLSVARHVHCLILMRESVLISFHRASIWVRGRLSLRCIEYVFFRVSVTAIC